MSWIQGKAGDAAADAGLMGFGLLAVFEVPTGYPLDEG
jgi:hypothetical protein